MKEQTASAEELFLVPSALPIALLPGFEDRTNSNKHATKGNFRATSPWKNLNQY